MKTIINVYDNFLEDISVDKLIENADLYNIYPQSIHKRDDSILFMIKHENMKYLIIIGKGKLIERFQGEYSQSRSAKICPLNHINANLIREYFSFTSPVSYGEHPTSLGLGDRLGLASMGHIRLLKDYNVFPILAQQSIRELNLTGRDYNDVLDSASWAVFQEGYELGFGADGDHLKTVEEVQMALDCGFTMITLDCSDHIDNSINDLNETEIEKKYLEVDKSIRDELENKYMDKKFPLDDSTGISIDQTEFRKIVLIYLDTIEFTSKIYHDLISNLDRDIDFELSIDETTFTTSVEAHYLIASELIRRGVVIASLAPRFPGEFQKGIDYIGNKNEFRKDFYLHFLISQHFNYKISVHSGSDKFDVFPIIGDISKGHYHLKTAGTNWLEALRVVASQDKDLFREVFKFAIDNLEEAKAYYHIKGDPNNLAPLDEIKDRDLVNLLNNDDARQILHITYGLILQEKNNNGEYVFRDKIYNLLNTHEDIYSEFLIKHIGRHLKELRLEKK